MLKSVCPFALHQISQYLLSYVTWLKKSVDMIKLKPFS